ncbi:MAG: transglutaminase domain-containing protein [Clostridia bacterium]|nr:transglutaminase domain-containing protein [Clostridia bacterium]
MPYTRYYRGQMDDQERAAYDALSEGVRNYQEDISLPNFPPSSMTRVFRAVNLDYPEFFYADLSRMQMSVGPFGPVAQISYVCSDSEARRLMDGIRRTADSIAAACQGKTPLEMEKLIHDELVRGCRYGSLPERPRSAHSIRGALLDGICVCEGYAKAFKFLADQVKLESLVAVGMAAPPGKSEEGHAWNMIKFGRRVYHLDVTFDRLVCNQYHSMSYFNLSDKEVQYDHTPDSLFKMPAAPVSGALIPTMGGTRQLMDYLKDEATRGVSYSEVRLTKGFPHKELTRMIFDRLEKEDHWWYKRIRAYVYGNGEKSLFILW